MNWISTILLIMVALAQRSYGQSTTQTWLYPHRWEHRLLLIFTPYRTHPMCQAQLTQENTHTLGYKERDLQTFVLTPTGGTAPTQTLPQEAALAFYERYQVSEAAFAVLLIGKDGGEKLRHTQKLLDVDLLFATIDGMPMRRREMQSKP